MKKLYLVGILIVISSLIFLTITKGNTQRENKVISAVSTPSISIMPENTVDIVFNERNFWLSWIKINNINNLSLYPNFQEKETARGFVEKYSCKFLTSAGFYTKDNQPLGLFITDGKVLKEKVVNNLIPEIFYITEDYQYGISESLPEGEIKYAIQIGPLLINNSQPRKLAIRSDEPARRIVMAIGTNREIYLLAVYGSEENFQGPTLTDLPKILIEFQKKTEINLQTAVNLDGGSASAFITDDLSLEEITAVGSFFCLSE